MGPLDEIYYLGMFSVCTLILFGFGYRFAKSFRGISPGQKYILFASICFTLGVWLGGLQSFLHIDGFRWGFVPSTLGVASMFMYFTEPWDIKKQRWGQPAFWTEKDEK